MVMVVWRQCCCVWEWWWEYEAREEGGASSGAREGMQALDETYLEDGGAATAAWHRVAEEESAPKALKVRRRTPVRMMVEWCVRLLLLLLLRRTKRCLMMLGSRR